MKKLFLLCFLFPFFFMLSAQTLQELSVEKIMRDPAWIGSTPRSISWSLDSRTIYFRWNPDQADSDSLYQFSLDTKEISKVSKADRLALPSRGSYNQDRSRMSYAKNGDIYLLDIASGKTRPIALSNDRERFLSFHQNGSDLFFTKNGNVYSWERGTGLIIQLTDFRKGKEKKEMKKGTDNEEWIKQEELSLIQVVKEREERQEKTKEARKAESKPRLKAIYYGSGRMQAMGVSPDGQWISYRIEKSSRANRTEVPAYVDASAFTQNLPARPKVGSPQNSYSSYLLDRQADSVLSLSLDSLPGVKTAPAYLADYGKDLELDKPKACVIYGPYWSSDSRHAVVVVRSQDFKDRWIAKINLQTGMLHSLDHQHDEAWIGGPGIVRWLGPGNVGWMPDDERFWFQSEASGYSHLYWVNVMNGKSKALTKGKYEIHSPKISLDKQSWYFGSNEEHPGERHYYRMPLEGGKCEKLTRIPGNSQVVLSPNEKTMAFSHSIATRPWELFFQDNLPESRPVQITSSVSDEFKSYSWREPAYVTFKAADGKKVHARLYRPENAAANGPAVIFVHGAGYLQNAHKWWSSYFREYMFHNLLVDKGYTVLDMDFRASAGYGRDWRTAVYRDMGGKDLSDQVDGAKYLVDEYGVDPSKIGIYGGSYGGFISLMAMFKEGDVFACGAALRPVTDWAHYNHPYTASMLNLPQDDSIAYVKSSPIYHAEGLSGPLLICHGMIDTNVHFQDVVRLSQRLIELGKDDWEVAMFPLEGHGFREPSSWTDEYKRILKLFETHLK